MSCGLTNIHCYFTWYEVWTLYQSDSPKRILCMIIKYILLLVVVYTKWHHNTDKRINTITNTQMIYIYVPIQLKTNMWCITMSKLGLVKIFKQSTLPLLSLKTCTITNFLWHVTNETLPHLVTLMNYSNSHYGTLEMSSSQRLCRRTSVIL